MSEKENKDGNFEIEIKEVSEEGEFEAMLAKFNNVDAGNDKIIPGAFAKGLKRRHRFPLLADHDTRKVIGGFTAKETDAGLVINGEFNLDTQSGKENHSNAKKGNKTGFSIGFSVNDFEIAKNGVRVLKELKLHEGSIVTFPMNDKARLIDIKSEGIKTKRDFEKFLREAGWSKSDATRIASKGFESETERRDADDVALLNSINNLTTLLKGFKNV